MAFIFKKIENLKEYSSGKPYQFQVTKTATAPNDVDLDNSDDLWDEDELDYVIHNEGASTNSTDSNLIFYTNPYQDYSYKAKAKRMHTYNSNFNTVLGIDLKNQFVYFPIYGVYRFYKDNVNLYNNTDIWTNIAVHEGYKPLHGERGCPIVIRSKVLEHFAGIEDLGDKIKLDVHERGWISFLIKSGGEEGSILPFVLEDKTTNAIDEIHKWQDAIGQPERWAREIANYGLEFSGCMDYYSQQTTYQNEFLNSTKIVVPVAFLNDMAHFVQKFDEGLDNKKRLTESIFKKITGDTDVISEVPEEKMPDFEPDPQYEDELYSVWELEDEVAQDSGEQSHLPNNRWCQTEQEQQIFDKQRAWRQQYNQKRTTLIGYDDVYVYIPLYNCITEYKLNTAGYENSTAANLYRIAKDFGFKQLEGCDYYFPSIKAISRRGLIKKLDDSDPSFVDIEFDTSAPGAGLNILKQYLCDSIFRRPVIIEDKSIDFEKASEQYFDVMNRALDYLIQDSDSVDNAEIAEYKSKNYISPFHIRKMIEAFETAFDAYKNSKKIAIPMQIISDGNDRIKGDK